MISEKLEDSITFCGYLCTKSEKIDFLGKTNKIV